MGALSGIGGNPPILSRARIWGHDDGEGWERGFSTVLASHWYFGIIQVCAGGGGGWEVLGVESCTPTLWKPPMWLGRGALLPRPAALSRLSPTSGTPFCSEQGGSAWRSRPLSGRMGVWGRPEQSESVLPFYFPSGAIPGEGLGHCVSPDHPCSRRSIRICFLMPRRPVSCTQRVAPNAPSHTLPACC